MGRKAKRTNTLYFEKDESIVFNELPEGYFYKNKFYPATSCFTALLKDGEVKIHSFTNGTWQYKNMLFSSLSQVYDYLEINYDIDISYKELKSHYEEYNIIHNPNPCTKYSYDRDEWNELFESKKAVLIEMRNDSVLIEDEEDREDRYLFNFDKEKCAKYFGLSIKERIKILEAMK